MFSFSFSPFLCSLMLSISRTNKGTIKRRSMGVLQQQRLKFSKAFVYAIYISFKKSYDIVSRVKNSDSALKQTNTHCIT